MPRHDTGLGPSENRTRFPPLPLEAWEDTKTTLHLYAQIVGKIRLTLHPKLNHWWHAPLYVSPRGLTTRPIPYGGRLFEIEFDFLDHNLGMRASDGTTSSFALNNLSVAEFYKRVFDTLAELGIDITIRAVPYDLQSKEPFATDHQHASYDKEYVGRFWRILAQIDPILQEFRGRFIGKSSPVHLFWHSFDLAMTRFSGRRVPIRPGMGMVEREAYSHEVISFGFWAGDQNVRGAAFYSYTYPEPEGLTTEPLRPQAAFWNTTERGSLALLMYDDVLNAESPRKAVLDFLESAYQAGVNQANWNREEFELRPPV